MPADVGYGIAVAGGVALFVLLAICIVGILFDLGRLLGGWLHPANCVNHRKEP